MSNNETRDLYTVCMFFDKYHTIVVPSLSTSWGIFRGRIEYIGESIPEECFKLSHQSSCFLRQGGKTRLKIGELLTNIMANKKEYFGYLKRRKRLGKEIA